MLETITSATLYSHPSNAFDTAYAPFLVEEISSVLDSEAWRGLTESRGLLGVVLHPKVDHHTEEPLFEVEVGSKDADITFRLVFNTEPTKDLPENATKSHVHLLVEVWATQPKEPQKQEGGEGLAQEIEAVFLLGVERFLARYSWSALNFFGSESFDLTSPRYRGYVVSF